jgi:hypothetical protein
MQRSYLVKSPVHFADFGFFVKIGDILVHDTSNANRLTVYRNGEVVKAVKQTSLGIAAMVKNEFIVEVAQQAPSPKAAPRTQAKPIPEAPKPAPKKAEAPKPAVKPEPKTSFTAEEFTPAVKRGKAVGKEVPYEEMPERLKKALEEKDAS